MSSEYDGIGDIVDSLQLYVKQGVMPGDFLTAVLENNLSEACGRADLTNQRRLIVIVRYVYNRIPSAAWGSPAKVTKWVRAIKKQSREACQ